MIPVAALSVAAIISAVLALMSGRWPEVAAFHLGFAIGIVPLILAAMTHFVAVLTRSGEAGLGIRFLPFVAQAAGLVLVAILLGSVQRALLPVVAGVDLMVCAILLVWIIRRARACVGSPHPGWRWYAAGLSAFALSLVLILLMVAFPQWVLPIKSAHLHLNTLGFVGLAALGTLPVLMPTALAQPDPGAGVFLRQRLFPFVLGVLLLAAAPLLPWATGKMVLAILGATMQFWVLGKLLWHWVRQFGFATIVRDGVSASLAAAVCAWLMLLLAGGLHGLGLIAARRAIMAWGAGFLLPLVTGALSQLLPVWRWPGPRTERHPVMRANLARGGPWRAACFFTASVLLIAGQNTPAALFCAAGLGGFLFALLRAYRG